MKKLRQKVLVSLLLSLPLIATALDQAQQSDNVMTLKNTRGSVLTLEKNFTDVNSGTLTGTFVTAVASKNCQQVIGQPFPVLGFFNGNAVSYSIQFTPCGSVLSTVGNFDQNNNLHVLWLIAKQAQNSETQDWNMRLVGHDDFVVINEDVSI